MDQNNFNKIFQNIIARKSIFLIVVIVLISFVSAIILFGDYSSKIVDYQNQNQKKVEKIDQIVKYHSAKKGLKNFVASLPKPLGADELVAKMEDYAIDNHLNIVNVSSKDAQKNDEHMLMEIHLTVKVQDFKDLVSFFHVLETSPYSFKIQSWSARKSDVSAGSIDSDINLLVTQLSI